MSKILVPITIGRSTVDRPQQMQQCNSLWTVVSGQWTSKSIKVTIASFAKASAAKDDVDHKEFKVTIAVGITSSHSEQSS